MRVLVTGAAGMLGTDILATAPNDVSDILGADLRDSDVHLDITQPAEVYATLERLRPGLVLHCAAYTNVDHAEADPDTAYKVNALGSWALATACARVGAALCYVSTDYVFDGCQRRPYHEFDVPRPLNVYGATKLAGEHAVRSHCPQHWIVRTAWLYGLHGRSFVRTVLERAAKAQPLRVVADQIGSPTFTRDLAEAIWQIVREAPYGVYHRVNSGFASWYELALAAVRLAGLDDRLVSPIAASEWPSPVVRPSYSVLTSLSAPSVALTQLRPWQEALACFVMEGAGSHGEQRQ